ncbi:MAG: tetratricopeptide repeat protein [Prevotellaceae bacterium]|jgi:tetratricopeptide (TPR) repeat protein|nr:tetratricopeptide repeat protein [Prevotellaceae bacterium]
MKKLIITFAVLINFFAVFAQENNEKRAAELYAEKDYVAAAAIYDSLLKHGESADLYYNYANVCYKLDNLGKAILYYEKALKISPLHADAKANLDFVNTKITDKIDELQPFFLTEWFSELGKIFTSNQWAYLSIGLFAVAAVLAMFFLFFSYRRVRKISFFAGIILLVLSIFSFYYAFSQKKYAENNPFAIIISGSVSVKSSPASSGTELFLLHEGTKIKVLSSLGEWSEIELSDEKTGWVLSETMEEI